MKAKIFNNMGLKVISLIIAILIWFHATTEKNYSFYTTVPIKYRYTKSDTLVIVSNLPRKIGIKVQGKGKALLKLKFTKTYYVINIGKLKFGKNLVDYTDGNLAGVGNIQILDVLPEKVYFFVDRIKKKKIYRITPVIAFPRDSLILKDIKVNPTKLTIIGPASYIKSINELHTDTLRISSMKMGEDSIWSSIKLPNRLAKILPYDSVLISYFAVPYINDTTNNIPVLNNDSVRLLIVPESVRVIIRRPQETTFVRLSRYICRPVINMEMLAKNKIQKVSISCNVPSRVKFISTIPQYVTVEIKKTYKKH